MVDTEDIRKDAAPEEEVQETAAEPEEKEDAAQEKNDKSEEAAKQLGAGIFDTKIINVPASFFSGWTLPDTFEEVAQAVYGKKVEIPGLEDAEDILE